MTITDFNSLSLEERNEVLRQHGHFVIETAYPNGKSAFYTLFDFNVEVVMKEDDHKRTTEMRIQDIHAFSPDERPHRLVPSDDDHRLL